MAGLRERGGLRCCGLGLFGGLGRRRLDGRGRGLGVRLGRRIRRGGRVFAGLGLITGLFFATGLCIPRGIATGGLIDAGLGLPRRRLGACGFNYHMLSNGPTGVHPGSVPNKLAIGGVHAKEAAVLARSAASSNNMHAAEPGLETPGSS